MKNALRFAALVAVLLVSSLAAAQKLTLGGATDLPPAANAPTPATDAGVAKQFKDAAILLRATVQSVTAAGQTNSIPPHVFYEVRLKDITAVRGKKPTVTSFSCGDPAKEPALAEGKAVIVALNETGGVPQMVAIAEATPENLKAIGLGGSATSQPTSSPASQPADKDKVRPTSAPAKELPPKRVIYRLL